MFGTLDSKLRCLNLLLDLFSLFLFGLAPLEKLVQDLLCLSPVVLVPIIDSLQ